MELLIEFYISLIEWLHDQMIETEEDGVEL